MWRSFEVFARFPKTIPQDIPIYGAEEYELMNPIHNVHLHTWYISDLYSKYIHAKCLMCVIFKKYMQYDLFKKIYVSWGNEMHYLPTESLAFLLHLHLSNLSPCQPFPLWLQELTSGTEASLVIVFWWKICAWSLHAKNKGSFEKKKTETGSRYLPWWCFKRHVWSQYPGFPCFFWLIQWTRPFWL